MQVDPTAQRYIKLIHAMAEAAGSTETSPLNTLLHANAHAADEVAACRVEDTFGHARPVYIGLAAATLARRMDLTPAWERRCTALLLDWPQSPTADAAPLLAGAAWADYALWVSGKSDATLLRAVVARRQPDGPFLLTEGADNPEPWWFAELAILHAVTSYALISNDVAALTAAQANAIFHNQETQPDHATSQPWGINAFIAFADARPLADQVLLSMQTQQPGGLGAVSKMLLMDTVAAMATCA